MGPRRAAIYIRVSTDDQAKDGFSLAAQRERLEAYCRSKEWTIVDVYREDGHSGRTTARPAYQRMMADRDAWDVVVVLKMDRIHRNSRNFMEMMEDLRESNKDFASATESFDTSTAMGRFVMDIIQRIAQLESEQIGERVYMGMSQKAREGAGILGFQPPLGYDVRDGRLAINPKEADTVRDIFDRAVAGQTLRSIASDLNRRGVGGKRRGRWTVDSVWYVLHNPVYAGHSRWDSVSRLQTHPSIVNQETFKRTQDSLRSRAIRPPRPGGSSRQRA